MRHSRGKKASWANRFGKCCILSQNGAWQVKDSDQAHSEENRWKILNSEFLELDLGILLFIYLFLKVHSVEVVC